MGYEMNLIRFRDCFGLEYVNDHDPIQIEANEQ